MSASGRNDPVLQTRKKPSKHQEPSEDPSAAEGSGAPNRSSLSNSSAWSNVQPIMLQEYDIARMNEESLVESIQPMEEVYSDLYTSELIEEYYELMKDIDIFLTNLSINLLPKLKNYPIKFYNDQRKKFRKCLHFTPISKNFNFTSCTVSQFWAIVILAAKCCGEIFANTWIGYFILPKFLIKVIPSLFFVYIMMPIFACLLNQKIPMSKVSLAERRWLVLAFSFWVGASTHYILMNWDPGVFPPPPMYSPTLVALLFEFTGPILANNRPQLLWSTIGVASFVCFAYAVVYSRLTFTYFYTSVTAIASSFYNMQLHLADPKLGRGDMSEGHVLLPIKSMYNQLIMTLLFGHYNRNRDPRTTAPDSLEEQYTHLLVR